MEQDEPISLDELFENAYESAYEDHIKLDSEGGVHDDSMPRIRKFAGNENSGSGAYTQSRTVEAILFEGTEQEQVDELETGALIDGIVRAMRTGTEDSMEDRDMNPRRGL